MEQLHPTDQKRIGDAVRRTEKANALPADQGVRRGQSVVFPPASDYMVWQCVAGKWLADWPRIH